jgi:hypothetical protein
MGRLVAEKPALFVLWLFAMELHFLYPGATFFMNDFCLQVIFNTTHHFFMKHVFIKHFCS